jgi:hypothetical protein
MTERRFRALLFAYLLTLVAGLCIAAMPGLVPEPLESALREVPELVADGALLPAVLLGVPILVASIASIVGLFLLKPWSRSLAAWTTVATLPLYVLAGPSVMSGIGSAIHDVSSMLWGAILLATFVSPLSDRFSRTNSPPS